MTLRKSLFVVAALLLIVTGLAAFQSQMNLALSGNFLVMPMPTSSTQNATTPWFNPAVISQVVAKPTQGNLYGYFIGNPNSAPCYLQFYDGNSGTAANPAAPPVFRFALMMPPNGAANLHDNIALSNFGNGIMVASATTPTGTTPCTTGLSVTLWMY